MRVLFLQRPLNKGLKEEVSGVKWSPGQARDQKCSNEGGPALIQLAHHGCPSKVTLLRWSPLQTVPLSLNSLLIPSECNTGFFF